MCLFLMGIWVILAARCRYCGRLILNALLKTTLSVVTRVGVNVKYTVKGTDDYTPRQLVETTGCVSCLACLTSTNNKGYRCLALLLKSASFTE